jgi:hypothetical protein
MVPVLAVAEPINYCFGTGDYSSYWYFLSMDTENFLLLCFLCLQISICSFKRLLNFSSTKILLYFVVEQRRHRRLCATDSVVDPNPNETESFGWIRIRRKVRIWIRIQALL